MRILIIVSEAPPIASGVSRCADELTRGLRGLGADVDIISSNEIRRWTFGEFRVSSFVGYWPRISSRLADYDLVNLHGPVPTMSDLFLIFFRSLPRFNRPALVYTHHSSVDIEGLGRLCRLYDAATSRLVASADRIVVSTPSYATMVGRPGGPMVDVVPWGVHAAAFRRERHRAPDGPLRVLFVGQMRQYKGIAQLLAAVHGHPDLRLTVAGSGALEGQYRQEAATRRASNVTFLGRVTDDRLQSLYAEHDVIALPSTTRAEAFGLVLLEGMAAGCVPVASDLPGVRDVAGPTGVLVPPGDAVRLRHALLDLGRDRAKLERLGQASQRVADAMSWDLVTDRYLSTFRAAIRDVGHLRGSLALRAPFLPPDVAVGSLAQRFDASWWSLLLFHGRAEPRLHASWGRMPLDVLHRKAPSVAEYVARNRRPILIDNDVPPSAIQDLMTREDVASAMSVPIQMRRGSLGVLNLSLATGAPRRYTHGDLDRLVRLVAS